MKGVEHDCTLMLFDVQGGFTFFLCFQKMYLHVSYHLLNNSLAFKNVNDA